jgi:hypothetical protein
VTGKIPLSVQAVGGLFGLPFRELYDYLKGVKDTREVQQQLRNVLQSLDVYKSSRKAFEESRKALLANFENLKIPTSSHDLNELVGAWVNNVNDLSEILASVRMFAKECNDLISGDFDAFMLKVKTRKPIVHDFLSFFGRNYNPSTGSLELMRLPMLVRRYGSKIGWKESKETSKEVEEGSKTVRGAIEKTRAVVSQRPLPRISERRLIRDYMRAVRRLATAVKSLQTNKIVDRQLWENSPSWFVAIMDLGEEVSLESSAWYYMTSAIIVCPP